MVPESIITGDFLGEGASTNARQTALHLYSYIALRQGSNGWAVRGFRAAAKAIGVQEKTVSKYAKLLDEAGFIKLTLERPVSRKAEMKMIHNPSLGIVNPQVSIGPPPKRYRHDSVPYNGDGQVVPRYGREPHVLKETPVAWDAAGSRSPRSDFYVSGTREVLRPMLTAEERCKECLCLVAVPPERSAGPAEFCQCPFEERQPNEF